MLTEHVGASTAKSATGGEASLYQGIVSAAAVVTGARFVNLSQLEHGSIVRGSVWGGTDLPLIEKALSAARYVVPGFDPTSVRFRSDVNPAVRRVFIEGRPCFATFAEHVEGTVHPLVAGLAQSVIGLRWTHSVPLKVAGEVAGALAFHWDERPHPRSLAVAEAFSAQVELTFQNVRLAGELRARVADIERSRDRIASAAEGTRREIAESLDRVGSRLLVVTQRVLECRALAGSSPADAEAELARLAEELDRLRDDDVRAASHRLHPSLISIGLVPALEMLSDSFAGLDVRVNVAPGVSAFDGIARNALPQGVRLAVYRSVEEAIEAIAASGVARGARVEVAIEAGALRTVVVDEGGQALGELPVPTLCAIGDRIERVDGTVEVDGDADEARLVALVPLPQAAHHDIEAGPGTGLFQSISDNALGVTGARMVSLSWYVAEQQVLEFGALSPFGALGRMVEAARKVVPGFDVSQLRFRVDLNPAILTVFAEGRPLLAPTVEHAAGVVHPAILRVGMTMLGFAWTYSVPLRVEGSVVGALAFHFPDRPGAAALAIADVFASQAALTLANQRLSAALGEHAAELAGSRDRIAAAEERVRREIAEVLHGRVQSRLLVVAYRLSEASAAVRSDPGGVAATLEGLARELDRIREEDLRQITRQLHPVAISVGLIPALQELADSLGPRLDVRVDANERVVALDHPLYNAIPEGVRLGVYRCVEEALANTARHGDTSSAAVSLDLDGEAPWLIASVVDRGRGYDPARVRRGMGTRAMADRVERLGGSLEIASAPGRGTAVTLRLPVGGAV